MPKIDDVERGKLARQQIDQADPVGMILVGSRAFPLETEDGDFAFDFALGSDQMTHKAVMMRIVIASEVAPDLLDALGDWFTRKIEAGDAPVRMLDH